jgi:hypothetical protein
MGGGISLRFTSLLRLFIKICKHIFVSLRYAEPRVFLLCKNGVSDPDHGKLNTDQEGLYLIWLESVDIFQTFSELDKIKDKKEEIRLIRQLINDDIDTKPH